MKKTFVLEDLDCAHCAAKIEEAVSKIEGVNECTLSFIAGRLSIDADEGDFDRIIKETKKIIKKIEPDCTLEA